MVQYFPGDDLLTPLQRRRGLPIGNLTSQFFANIYLNSLDHFVKDTLRVKRYLRYVDDFCCFEDDKTKLRDIREAIVEHLLTLRLRLNERKSRIRQLKEGVEFLGFVHFPLHTRINQRAIRRQRKRIRLLQQDYRDHNKTWEEVVSSLRAWGAHASHGTTRKLQNQVFWKAVFSRENT